jgi:hypothetical protein
MYDESFSGSSLRKLISDRDLKKVPFFAVHGAKDLIASQASILAGDLFGGVNPLKLVVANGKEAFCPTSVHADLILRKISVNLKRSFVHTNRGRRFIVSTLISHLAEGLPYRLYKRDIYHFYQSFPHSAIGQAIDRDTQLTSMTKLLLKKVIDTHHHNGGSGLPRGLGISAILSEKLMQDFDKAVRTHPEVRFYARYVDDIVVLTNGTEDVQSFNNFLKSLLPKGLRFNALKTAHADTDPVAGAPTTGQLLQFNYLGYSIQVMASPSKKHRKEFGRQVIVDLSDSKVKKLKRRIARTLHAHIKKQDFALTKMRLSFLTANASLPVPGEATKRLVGIHHTYPLITVCPSCKLHELDRFLRCQLLSSSGHLCSELFPLLSKAERKELLAFSFLEGFKTRRFVKLSRHQFLKLRECWIHE